MIRIRLAVIFCLGILLGANVGVMLGRSVEYDMWQNRLIEAELAEFVVDSQTGDTTFIIYAEQETK